MSLKEWGGLAGLIKTPGSQINYGVVDGSSLPSGRIYLTESPAGDFDDSAILISSFSFTGSVTINNPTCNVENKTVNLGAHSPTDFSAVGDGSSWVDSSLTINCNGQFNGYAGREEGYATYDYANERWEYSRASGTSSNLNNTPFIHIYPVYGYAGESEGSDMRGSGIIALDDSAENAASGLGIQLAQNQGGNLGVSVLDASALVAFSSTTVIGSTSFKVPLYARYVKISDEVTAGRANSKVTYTMNYK